MNFNLGIKSSIKCSGIPVSQFAALFDVKEAAFLRALDRVEFSIQEKNRITEFIIQRHFDCSKKTQAAEDQGAGMESPAEDDKKESLPEIDWNADIFTIIQQADIPAVDVEAHLDLPNGALKELFRDGCPTDIKKEIIGIVRRILISRRTSSRQVSDTTRNHT